MGEQAYTSATTRLNARIEANPAANATRPSGMSVDSIKTRAHWARCARASAAGPAPTSATSSRSSCRSEYPNRPARPAAPSRSTTPSPIRRIARAVTSERQSHAGEPGAASGRQRLHAR